MNKTDLLKRFMAEHKFSPSDIYMAMVPIINEKGNGIIRGQERSRVLVALRASPPQRTMNSGLESCSA